MLPTPRTSCSLHVLVPHIHPHRPDPTGLVTTLADRLETVTAVAWGPTADDIDLACVRRAADVLDEIEVLVGGRPGYEERHGPLDRAIECHLAAHHRPGRVEVVALASDAPRSILRAVRRAVAATGSHVALVPHLDTPVRRPVGR